MVDVREVYEASDGFWYSYQPMLNLFGYILVQVDDRDYQGDSRLLLDRDGTLGYLQFGWGSCSGCDALQACKDIDEVQELANALEDRIIWLGEPADALEWFNNHNWEGDYSWNAEEQQEFIEKAKKYLLSKLR